MNENITDTVTSRPSSHGGWFDFWFSNEPLLPEPINTSLVATNHSGTWDTEETTTQIVEFISTVLVTETSTVHPEFLCVKDEWTEPDFPRYACSGSKITSWIASVFLLSMIVFGVIKCLTTHGLRNIFDLRVNGTSFPQRPEFFVLLCSSLPLVFTTLSRPLFTPLSLYHDIFIRGWGLAQTRFFFDLFTRSASIYHLVYWVYRTPIITILWRIKTTIERYYLLWKNRPKPVPKPRKSLIPTKTLGSGKPASKQPPSRGRTSEHGTGKKRNRSKSIRSNRINDKPSSQTSSDPANPANDPNAPNPHAPVITAGGVSVIAPQPLFPVQPAVYSPYTMGGMVPGMTGMNPYNQSPIPGAYSYGVDGYNMYGNVTPGTQTPGMSPSYGMGFGYGMGMGMPGQGFGQQPPMFPMGQSSTPISEPSMLGVTPNTTETSNLLEMTDTEDHAKSKKAQKELIIQPPPSRSFVIVCKRVIPGLIYLASFLTTLPSVFAFQIEPNELRFVAARCTQLCRSYFYYDLVMLVTVPTILLIVGFFHGALSKTQLNGGIKMSYRLRCYYVTFILLNIPMFVLMLTSIGFRLTQKPYRNIYGTGILIAMTAYHANFALKSTVYTTACNCICCTDSCLRRVPIVDRFITFFTTPVAVKDRERLLEGSVIPVPVDTDTKTAQK